MLTLNSNPLKVLKDMELHRQKIQEAKGKFEERHKISTSVSPAWIQNGLMTVVGVGVMAYLQV